ncbi:phage holin family protein [Brooklawnia cerclae]|uniref:Membrane protein n=1 Tax=Brooklawnia cerclae TaxID=349934 RepID=A0ABX0SP78_9ACTN|nr:phage holin family protein [Brooklawnia cerclae]NIH58601.1 putative membrane protein [Brooklawnia cerclae]
MNLVLRVLATAAAVWVAGLLVPGIHIAASGVGGAEGAGTVVTLLIVAVVIGLVNAVVKPIVEAFSGCMILLTLGLFLLVINAAMLMLSAWICARLGVPFTVEGWGAAFLGSIVVSIVSGLINGLTGVNRDSDQGR